MKKLVLIATFFTIISTGNNLVKAQTFKFTMPPGYNAIVQGETLPGVEGSQYFKDEWTLSSIAMNDGSTIDSIELRLNAYKGEMHYNAQNVEYVIGAPDKIKEIIMGNRKFIYGAYMDGGKLKEITLRCWLKERQNFLFYTIQ